MSIDMPDLSNVQSDSDIVPVGTYTAVIREAEYKLSNVKQTPGIEVSFQILGPTQANRYVWDTLWLSPKALGRTRGCLEAAGVVIPAGPFTFSPESLIGKALKIIVKHEPARDGYDAKAKVNAWKAAEGVAEGLNAAEAGRLAAEADADDIPF